MSTSSSTVNWADIAFQFGWLVFLVAIGFLIYKIVKIKRRNRRLKK